jgi:Spy/CpxP family protein refolding chaperone
MQRVAAAFAAAVLLAGCVSGDPEPDLSPYAGRVDDPIAGLTAEQVDDLRNARGMGYALAAELNGYPGPRHVLDLADDLGLDASQRERVQSLFDGMRAEAIPAGERVIAAHAALDALFAAGNATREAVDGLSQELGDAEADLRAIHLARHLDTLEVLTSHQVQQYQVLRGYADGMDHAHGQHA